MVPRVARILYFFFSSRGRHTMFKCDWSSDVCSSDLEQLGRAEIRERPQAIGDRERVARRAPQAATQHGGGLVVVEVLVRANSLREQVAGRLLGGDTARRQREQRDRDDLDEAAHHGASSRRTMSV